MEQTFTNENEMLVGFYFNNDSREQQEIVEVAPHSVKPVLSFEKDVSHKLASVSVLNQASVLKEFVNILCDEKTQAELKVQVLKSIAHMLSVLKSDFMGELKSNDLLSKLLSYLFKAKLAN